MMRTFRDIVLVLLVAFPATAAAGPGRWQDEERVVITERMGQNEFSCSAGGEGSVLVAAAVLGTVLARRRAQD